MVNNKVFLIHKKNNNKIVCQKNGNELPNFEGVSSSSPWLKGSA